MQFLGVGYKNRYLQIFVSTNFFDVEYCSDHKTAKIFEIGRRIICNPHFFGRKVRNFIKNERIFAFWGVSCRYN